MWTPVSAQTWETRYMQAWGFICAGYNTVIPLRKAIQSEVGDIPDASCVHAYAALTHQLIRVVLQQTLSSVLALHPSKYERQGVMSLSRGL